MVGKDVVDGDQRRHDLARRPGGLQPHSGCFARIAITAVEQIADDCLIEVAQRRRHELLAKLIADDLPTEAEEEADPSAADRLYDITVAALRDLTRSRSRFPLVADENAEYGFRRNCLGLRPLAIAVALLVLVISGFLALFGAHAQFLLPTAASLLLLGFWTVIVKPHWVRSAADRYAVRLLETVEWSAPASPDTLD